MLKSPPPRLHADREVRAKQLYAALTAVHSAGAHFPSTTCCDLTCARRRHLPPAHLAGFQAAYNNPARTKAPAVSQDSARPDGSQRGTMDRRKAECKQQRLPRRRGAADLSLCSAEDQHVSLLALCGAR